MSFGARVQHAGFLVRFENGVARKVERERRRGRAPLMADMRVAMDAGTAVLKRNPRLVTDPVDARIAQAVGAAARRMSGQLWTRLRAVVRTRRAERERKVVFSSSEGCRVATLDAHQVRIDACASTLVSTGA